jgi:hypothetical protein
VASDQLGTEFFLELDHARSHLSRTSHRDRRQVP